MSIDDKISRWKQADEAMRRALDPHHGLSESMKVAMGLSPHRSAENELIKASRYADEMRKTLSIASGAVNIDSKILSIASGAANIEIAAASGFSDCYAAQVKALQGALPDFQRSGLLQAASQFDGRFNEIALASQSFAERFRLPEVNEFSRLAREASSATQALQSLSHGTSPYTALTHAMESMKSPWLLRDDAFQSATAFSNLHGIGNILNTRTPFDEAVAQSLRGTLGDWRQVTSFPTTIFENAVARSEFYTDLGFDGSLTEFTAEAFDETTILAGLRGALAEDDNQDDKDDEVGLARSNRAHAQIIRFERKVRHFIENLMTAEFGGDWMQRQLPQGMLESWEKKEATEVAKGRTDQPLIAYADFADYIKIIERKDNWNRVFKVVFKRLTDIQEAFTRLFPVRICTMHSRIITLDDELLLLVETRRIQKALSGF